MLHFFWPLFNMYRSSGSTLKPIPTTLKFQLNQKRKNAETINFVQLFINFNYNLTELNGILNDYSSRVAFFREKFIFSFFIIPNEWVIQNDMHFNLFLRLLYCIWYDGGYFTFYLDTRPFKFSGTFNVIEQLNYSQFLLPNAICLFIFSNWFWLVVLCFRFLLLNSIVQTHFKLWMGCQIFRQKLKDFHIEIGISSWAFDLNSIK